MSIWDSSVAQPPMSGGGTMSASGTRSGGGPGKRRERPKASSESLAAHDDLSESLLASEQEMVSPQVSKVVAR